MPRTNYFKPAMHWVFYGHASPNFVKCKFFCGGRGSVI